MVPEKGGSARKGVQASYNAEEGSCMVLGKGLRRQPGGREFKRPGKKASEKTVPSRGKEKGFILTENHFKTRS